MKNENKFQLRRLTLFLENIMPYLVFGAVIGFGVWGIGIQRDTRRAAENTEQIIIQLEGAVEDITEDNRINTEYLDCLLGAHDIGTFDTAQCIQNIRHEE